MKITINENLIFNFSYNKGFVEVKKKLKVTCE